MAPGIVLDFDAYDRVVGIEIEGARLRRSIPPRGQGVSARSTNSDGASSCVRRAMKFSRAVRGRR
ncbi:MAG: DUF2283 domain-containing protein [Thermoflexus hugenholtzii]|nr:MAG: DUF2283 domain-containing protein [Thermoflexus hugenholtzii]